MRTRSAAFLAPSFFMMLARWSSIVRGLIEHAAMNCTIEEGQAVPNTLLTNVAKYHFAHNYHEAVQVVQVVP